MTEQINLRLPDALLKDARQKAKSRGFSTVQSYIEQTVREDIYDDIVLNEKEKNIIERLMKARGDPRVWGTENEMWQALRKQSGKKEKSRKIIE